MGMSLSRTAGTARLYAHNSSRSRCTCFPEGRCCAQCSAAGLPATSPWPPPSPPTYVRLPAEAAAPSPSTASPAPSQPPSDEPWDLDAEVAAAARRYFPGRAARPRRAPPLERGGPATISNPPQRQGQQQGSVRVAGPFLDVEAEDVQRPEDNPDLDDLVLDDA